MSIFQIVLFCIVCCFVSVIIKNVYPELFTLTVVACGISITILCVRNLLAGYSFFKQIFQASGITNDVLIILIKIVAICYFSDFGIGIIEEIGIKSLVDKVSIMTKIAIFTVAIPIFKQLFEIIKVFNI